MGKWFLAWATGFVLFVGGATVHAETATSSSEPVILQMADGKFYAPASGIVGSTREEMVTLLTKGISKDTTGTSSDAVSSTSAVLISRAPLTLLQAIRSGQKQLRDALATASSSPVTLSFDDGWRDIRVAIWERENDSFVFASARKKGSALRCVDDTCRSVGLRVERASGPNSAYVTDGTSTVVVAVQYPLFREERVSKHKRVYHLEPVVFTPPASELKTPETVAEGKRVFDGYVAASKTVVDAHTIRSRAFPDRSLTDVITSDLAESVIVVEHTDLASLRVNTRSALEWMFAHIAANRDAPYAADLSSAGALGLTQFIPSTYKTLTATHPELGLIADFREGMRDPENAVRAEIAYLDELLAVLPRSVRETFTEDPATASEFIVAAYNAGPSRIKKTIPLWEEAMRARPKASLVSLEHTQTTLNKAIKKAKKAMAATPSKKKKKTIQAQLATLRGELASVVSDIARWHRARLKTETVVYVKKYREVADVLRHFSDVAVE